jgi:predicted DNA-binding transcriptional regulator AlpA
MPKSKSIPATTDEQPERALPERVDPALPLGPNQTVRFQDGHLYFGIRTTQLDHHIQQGNIPVPITISDSKEKGKASRARGWVGSQILDWQKARLAKPRPVRIPRRSTKD